MTDADPAPGARRSIVVGTAGHIDHGKSALVQALTGTDPDRLKEEKARGITIDLGFAHTEVGDVTVAFVDVPGHEKFVRNMLAGAGGIDAVLLVVAADGSVMPQTREHFDICRLLGIRHGVIAITKTDLVDADTIDLVALEVRELIAASALAEAPIVPVSARTGAGLDDLRRTIAALPAAARQAREGVVRLPVDRVFTMKGFGTVVTGTLVSGRIADGDELLALPGEHRVRVRGLQAHGHAHAYVEAPHRVALNLGGVEGGDLSRGVTIASPGSLTVSTRADLEIELLPGARPIRHGARVRVHQGTSEIAARVSIAASRGAGSAGFERAQAGQAGVEIPAGGGGFVRVRFDAPAVLTWGDRVVIRALTPPITIAGGTVLDPAPPRSGIRRPSTFDRFQRLRTPRGAEQTWLGEALASGRSESDLVRRGGLSPSQAHAMIGELVSAGEAVEVDGRIFAADVVGAIDARILELLAAHHRRAPLDEGLARSALREAVAPRGSVALFDARVDHLLKTGVIRGTDRLALAGHQSQISGAEADLQQRLMARAREAGLAALDATALAQGGSAPPDAVEHALRQLVKDQQLVRLESMYADAAALANVAEDLRRAKREAGELKLDVAAVKDRYGLTRKHAIPLLEWLDRTRVTRRIGNVRVVL